MNKLKIVKVHENNFKDLVFMMRKLAKFINLKPPSIDATHKLKKDLLTGIPKYEAYIELIDDQPVGYVIFIWLMQAF